MALFQTKPKRALNQELRGMSSPMASNNAKMIYAETSSGRPTPGKVRL